MGTEITCVLRDRKGDSLCGPLVGIGGPGWTQDLATAIGEIMAGCEYHLRLGDACIRVLVVERDGRPFLRSDPDAAAGNVLHLLPLCG
jgi:hypothetical protein